MILTYQSIWLAIWHAKDAQEMQELLYLPGMRVQSEVVSRVQHPALPVMLLPAADLAVAIQNEASLWRHSVELASMASVSSPSCLCEVMSTPLAKRFMDMQQRSLLKRWLSPAPPPSPPSSSDCLETIRIILDRSGEQVNAVDTVSFPQSSCEPDPLCIRRRTPR